VQDGLLGAYNLTAPTMRIEWKDAMNIVSYTTLDDFSAFKKGQEYTGAQLFSVIIPSNISTKNAGLDVENGIIKSGRLKKEHLGAKKPNSLIHLIWDEYGIDETKTFLDNTQKIVNNFNLLNGFTVGIGDIEITPQIEQDLFKLFENKELKIDHLITEMENNPDLMDNDMFELTIYSELNSIRENVSKLIMTNLSPNNNFNIMISSGSKGEAINMGQMACCIGQQAVEGKRIQKKVNHRSLAYFFQNDDSALGRGFIEQSYLRGAHPISFIFHNMSSREGLIDTAIKSVTGDTPIVILENGKTRIVNIGDWIDSQLKESIEKVKHYEERDMELLDLEEKIYIPTSDRKGNVSWGEIKAITRHDPGKELYQIKTLGGRKVIVTESNSLLIWNKNEQKFKDMLTPDVVIGDCVPTIMKLYEPPIIIKYIDMTKYFPKNKYVYGTDFWIAINEMNKAMEGRIQIPRGWWSENNGKKFTLPYTKVAILRRATKKLTTKNIKNGFIYPYFGTREHILIPDKFELNENNGLMIGLFLAEGNVDFESGYIQIANNEPEIQQFVNEWFNKFSINNKKNSKTNNLGLSEDVRGYSRILCKFLTKLVGHGAKNKFVPNEAFTAPDEFIVGVINGYISGDGTISKKGIEVGSVSEELINGISMLCSRLGIFGKISQVQQKNNNLGTKDIAMCHRLAIRGNWGRIFANKIPLLEKSKNKKLKEIKKLESHRNFQIQKDVVLDKIIQITKIDVVNYPKVYDLTVPSTYNFAIANGLVVKDTAESGYIQRKLIKSLEDAMIKYDLTVRNANNTIVQFIYGDNGIDTTKQYDHKLNLLTMGNKEIERKYKFDDNEIKNLKSFSKKDNDDYYEFLLEMRDLLRDIKLRFSLNYITLDTVFLLPVNLNRIIDNVKTSNLQDNEKLEPEYILNTLDDILTYQNTKILCMGKEEAEDKNSVKNRDEMICKTLLKFALHEYLAPKIVLFEHKLNKSKFDKIRDLIISGFNKSVVEPGEMIGTIAAQSIGEPVTQMSSSKETRIRLTGDINYSGPIGKFVDELLEKRKSDVFQFKNKHSILNLTDDNIKILGVSDKEKTSWQPILQVTRHPANGGLVKVTTRSGKTTTATLSHSFLKRTTNSITTIKGSDLKLGDRIPVAKYIPIVDNPLTEIKIGETNYKLDKLFGWFCGSYISDGRVNSNIIIISKILMEFETNLTKFCNLMNFALNIRNYQGKYGPGKDLYFTNKELANFLENNFGNGSYNKKIPAFVFGCNLEFINGLLKGLFDGDGNINSKRQMIRYGSRSEELIESICLLLNYNGIFASKLKEKTKNQPGKVLHTLCLIRKYASDFKNKIGLDVKEKSDELDLIIKYNNRRNKYYEQDKIDLIPELKSTVINICKLLKISRGQNPSFWNFQKDIGRISLINKIKFFKEVNEKQENKKIKNYITKLITDLEQAANNDLIWDKIVKLEYLDDPKEYVYDFTVPGNDSFMVDCGIFIHNTLNTFHHAGIGGMGTTTLGVPRIKELLSFSRNIKTPVMIVYLKEEVRQNSEMANKIASYIKYTTLRDIRDKVDIYYDPYPNNKEGFMNQDNVFNVFYSHNVTKYSCQADITGLPWLIRIELNKEKMMNKDITLLDIKSKFCNHWERRYRDTRGLKKEEKQLLERITQTSILSNNDNDRVPIVHIRFDMTDFDFSTIVSFLETFIESFKLKGLDNIQKINTVIEERVISFENEDQEMKLLEQNVVYTAGVNLTAIRYINGINLNKTITNDIVEVFENFGIEAARMILLHEIRSVFERAGNKVNYQHISVLVDIMTNNGTLTSIDRHGLNRIETDPLARASFEKTVDQIITAAVFGEVDHMKSVSSRIMAGLVIKGGTGLCELVLDTKLLENSEYVEDIEHKYKKTFIELGTNPIINDVINKDLGQIFVPE
ncbi:DNA-directed RNA polymerase subunit RPB1, partial [uncultured virus]